MLLKKFRTGLLGRFVKFGILPSVFVIVAVILLNTLFNVNAIQLQATELSRKICLRSTTEMETRNMKAFSTLSALTVALESGLYAKRADTLKFLNALAESNPEFGVFVAYEATSSPKSKPLTGPIPATDAGVDQAINPTGRFAPLFERDAVAAAHPIVMSTLADVQDSSYYKFCKQEFISTKARKVKLTQPHVVDTKQMIEFVSPIVIDGEFVGVAGLTRNLAFIRDRIKDLATQSGLNIMLITGQDNFICASGGDESVNEKLQSAYSALQNMPVDKTPWAATLRDFLSQTTEVVTDAVNPITNESDIHVMGFVNVGNWKVVVELPRALVWEQIWDGLRTNIIASILGIAIMAGLILYTAMKVVSQVSKVTTGISNTAIEMATSSQQQESVTLSFGSSSVQIAAAVRQITITGSELLRNMEKIALATSESSQNASAGRIGVHAMGSTMDGLASATSNVAERLSMIFEKASSINAIVDTITKVSDQTNLLSVNAAIEAEKAGESGRGFLVVAREIRRLADQTSSATLDIEKTVQQMQAAVSGGVMEMDRFSEQVRRGVINVSEVGQRLTQVIDQVGSVESSFGQVTEGMQSQVQGAEQIRQAMDALTLNASRAQEATSEFSRASVSLRESIMALRKVISGDKPA